MINSLGYKMDRARESWAKLKIKASKRWILVREKDNMVMRETDLGCPNIYCQHNSLRLAEDNIVLREPKQLFILGFALNNET